jgi:hypothetical protein
MPPLLGNSISQIERRFLLVCEKFNIFLLLEEGYQKYVIYFIQESADHPLKKSTVANW